MPERGKLFIVSGPSGVGKGALIRSLVRAMPDLQLAVSATTRERRPREVEDVDYRYIGDEEFDRHIRNGDFLEWAEVHGNRYGTLRENIEGHLDWGHNVLLEIDTQGALQVKHNLPESVLIFIGVGSMDELRKRLEKRGTETPAQIERRMRDTAEEMKRCGEYNVMIINDDFETASAKLTEVVRSYI
jgi:guanylate kinase